MKNFTLNEEQLKWLCTIVKYRIEDEQKEKIDLQESHRDEWLSKNQKRIDMWQSIYSELTKDGEYDIVR